jgi:predicted AlkP superfamily phosphohydrolase/phosphomutase
VRPLTKPERIARMADARKVCVIGLDAGTLDIMRPLIKEGRLPNFAKLVREGVSGELESVFPPVTPPAWVSIMTGKNPGKHGVFDFYGPPSLGYERPILNARYIKSKTLWSLLSEQGLRVGVINVPITHPPEKVNGFIVPGTQYAFDSNEGFSHPPELIDELKAQLGGYELAWYDLASLYTDQLDEFLERWHRITDLGEKATLHLMETRPWDFFMVVFYSIDPIQHHFWRFFDPTHPRHDPKLAKKYGDVIPAIYQKVDDALGKILQRLDKDTTVVVVSDHGAGPVHRSFHLNRWLEDEGLLVLKKSLTPLVRWKFSHYVYKALRRLKFPGIAWTLDRDQHWLLLKNRIDPREGLQTSYFIDWSRTKAFAANYTEQGVYINLRGREPQGIVEPGAEYERLRDHLIERLSRVVDPSTGKQMAKQVCKREDLYHGPYVDRAADLFLVHEDGTCLAQKELHPREHFGWANKICGTHRMNGVFILRGEGVRKGITLKGMKIMDVAPTILYALGLPIPDDMDGRVLVDGFEEAFVRRCPPVIVPAGAWNENGGDGIYAAEEGEKVKEALRGLGYMD